MIHHDIFKSVVLLYLDNVNIIQIIEEEDDRTGQSKKETWNINHFHQFFQTDLIFAKVDLGFLVFVLENHQEESVFQDSKYYWCLYSCVPFFDESKTSEFWCIHRSIDWSLNQKYCDQHSHSSRNLIWKLIYEVQAWQEIKWFMLTFSGLMKNENFEKIVKAMLGM